MLVSSEKGNNRLMKKKRRQQVRKARMVIITEQQFQEDKTRFLALRKAGKQVGIKNSEGKIITVVGTGRRRTVAEKAEAKRELKKLYQDIGIVIIK